MESSFILRSSIKPDTLPFMIFILAFILNTWAEPLITCTHPQICNLFNKSVFPLKLAIDPHHFEPSIGDVKKLLMAEVLAFGPDELSPWALKIKQNRSAAGKKNIEISIPEIYQKKYGTKDSPKISHFWLYPDILCSLIKDCHPNSARQKIEDLKKITSGKYLVLTHDALAPLLMSVGANVVSLKTSTHNCEIKPNSLKIIDRWREAKRSLIWLIEENIHTFQLVKGKIKKGDIILKIDITGKPGLNPFMVYDQIYLELEKVLNGIPSS